MSWSNGSLRSFSRPRSAAPVPGWPGKTIPRAAERAICAFSTVGQTAGWVRLAWSRSSQLNGIFRRAYHQSQQSPDCRCHVLVSNMSSIESGEGCGV